MKHLARLVLLVALAPAAYPQSVLHDFVGDSAEDWFGYSVSGAGDVNGDGYADLIVGAVRFQPGLDSGMARVFSGVDGSTLYTFDGGAPDDLFGFSVSSAGDVDNDGYDDVIVGARHDDTHNGWNAGSAFVFSGVDGSILFTLYGDSKGDRFGHSVSGAGDVNGDGHPDLIVGAYVDDNNGPGSGSARVFSGVDGSILYTFDGDSPGSYFGNSVGGAGDVDGDGFADLVVGARLDDTNGKWSGMARVFSGVDGSILHTFYGDAEEDEFGKSVSGAGDVNGDGHADLLVGAHQEFPPSRRAGYARVFSGVDGSILYDFDGDSPGSRFGISVSGAGDVNSRLRRPDRRGPEALQPGLRSRVLGDGRPHPRHLPWRPT